MKYTAIVFDFFGVFAPDVYPLWLTNNIPHWTDEKDYYLQLALSADEGRISKEQFLQALANKATSTPQLVAQGLDDFSLNQPMIALLQQVSATHKTALLCNGAAPIVQPILEANKLTDYFDTIVFSSEVGMAKPQPEIFRLVLDRLETAAEQAIFIDDRPVNVAGAASVGITSILYTDMPALQAELVKLNIAHR